MTTTELTANPAPLRRTAGRLDALRSRDFSLFWSAAFLSNIGTFMQMVTVAGVLYAMTGEGKWLGYASVAQLGPGLVIGPFASVAADRFQRRKIVLCSQAGQALMAMALWALWVTGHATPMRFLPILVLSGLSGTFGGPAWQSMVPLLAPPHALLSAVRLNTMQFTGSRAIGPAIGGLVYASAGAGWAFLVNGLSYLLVIAAMVVVRPRPQPERIGERRVLQEFADGVRYIRARGALRLVIASLWASVFIVGALPQLAAAFATDVYRVDRFEYGVLVGAFGWGSLVALVTLISVGDLLRRSRQTLIGFAINVAGLLLLAIANSYTFGLIAFFVLGAGFLTVGNALQLSMQMRVSEEFRGRVGGAYLITFQAAMPAGVLVMGLVKDLIGMRSMVIAASVVLSAYVAALVARSGFFRPFDETSADG